MHLFAGITAFILVAICSFAPAALSEQTPLSSDGPLTAAERAAFVAMRPPATKASKLPEVPSRKDMTPNMSNVSAVLGLPFMGRLKEGYEAFMSGVVDGALALLDEGMKDAWGDLMRFRLSLIKADLLVRADRAADAEIYILKTAALEREYWDKALLSRAARGDVRARLGDRPAAEGDLARVALAQKGWQLATEFDSIPDITAIAMNTEAKFRAALGLASLYIRDGQYAKGLAWAIELEKHFVRLFKLADHYEFGQMVPLIPEFYVARGENLAYLGAGILAVIGDAAQAELYFAAADGFFKSMRYTNGRAVTAVLRARALYDVGQNDAFEAAAVPAITLAVQAGLGELVWRLEALRGERFFEAGKLAEAEASLRRAQTAVALVSGALASDQSKLRFGLGKERLIQLLAAVDIARGQHGKLFQDMEQGRARAFMDMLANQTVASGDEAALMADIRRLQRDIRRQRLANATPGAGEPDGQTREKALMVEYTTMVGKLRIANRELADTLSVSAVTLADVQAQLLPGQMLAYGVPTLPGENLSWLLIEAEGSRVLETRSSQEELGESLEEFIDAVTQGANGAQLDIAAQLRLQVGLDQWGSHRGVFVVPTGNLYFMPWGALNTDYFVAVLPMGGWLNRGSVQNPTSAAATIVGDPNFFGQLPQLPGARAEATAVAGLYEATPMLGEDATEAALRRAIGEGISVLHLATHGSFDAAEPLNSAIVLTGNGKPARLTAARLFEAPLRAGLVVLSACETGVGRATAGDDYLGLTRSLYLGGARTVLNSLWPVADKGTDLYMRKFHEVARAGDYGAAWLAARNAARKQGYPPAVYGAFSLGGAAVR
ncbi:MAG: CHAT domain-containing protein [Rhodospirillaceae bacterium]|jgi:hypothetical protein|nr:CHAT domain-containing protein [Rhodospirillaceae bacterium]MBT4687999.1 CHAT domain-containing protein [Rhodospirillaceae bacterium]MBT5083487.1 CHAT domain-containing protein [Rhodospirillaceae bacterium]MBT6912922.1 CHAT domain-containing protein [Rhodospirillaceae bacterium]MBT7286985.1 CHAT domain-containing protein [Rhodospirillaceae bacterium]